MAPTRRIPICLVLAALVALACAAVAPAHGFAPRAWLTTGDRTSLLPQAADAAGIDFDDLVERILSTALVAR